MQSTSFCVRVDARLVRSAAAFAALLVAVLTLTGCGSSVYHHAGAMLPGDMNDRLALRVREARDAANAAMTEVDRAGAVAVSPAQAERVDALAWEYSRRVASVQDVIRRLPNADPAAQQVLASLQKAEAELNAAVQSMTDGSLEPLRVAAVSLASAVEGADSFVNGRANAGALGVLTPAPKAP